MHLPSNTASVPHHASVVPLDPDPVRFVLFERQLWDDLDRLLSDWSEGLSVQAVRDEAGFIGELEKLSLKYPRGDLAAALNVCDFASRDGSRRSVAGFAAHCGYAQALQWLIAQGGIDLSRNAALLDDVMRRGYDRENIFDVLIAHQPPLQVPAALGASVITANIFMNKPRLVEKLLQFEGIDPNAAGPTQKAPLEFAILIGRPNLVRTLLSSPRIDINRTNREGASAVEVALKACAVRTSQLPGQHPAASAIEEIVAALVGHPGFDANALLSDGQTLMAYAADHGKGALAAQLAALAHQAQNAGIEAEIDTLAARLGDGSSAAEALRALDKRSRLVCAPCLVALALQADLPEEQLRTAVTVLLEQCAALKADRLIHDITRRLPRNSDLAVLLGQLFPDQRVEAARLLEQLFAGQPRAGMTLAQLSATVAQVLETIRQRATAEAMPA